MACDGNADRCAEQDEAESGNRSHDHRRGGGGQRLGACGGKSFAGIGAVHLHRVGHHFLAGERLVESGGDRGCVIRVRLGRPDHGVDIGEIAFQRAADRLQLLDLGGVGGGFDLRQAAEHFGGASLGFGLEIGCLVRRGGKLVGHAADGDDVDTQVHRFAGNLFLSPHGGHRLLQAVEPASGNGSDNKGREPHHDDKKTDLPGNAKVLKCHSPNPAQCASIPPDPALV